MFEVESLRFELFKLFKCGLLSIFAPLEFGCS